MMKYKSGIILRQNQATYLDIIFLIETIKVIRSHYSTAERTQNLKSGILSYNFDFAIFYLCDIILTLQYSTYVTSDKAFCHF